MEITVRRFDIESVSDYKDVVQWWHAQKRAILAPELLPTLGFVVEHEGQKIAMSWLYCSDSAVGFVGWTTINPDAPKRVVPKAVKALEEAVAFAAKSAKIRLLFAFSGGGWFSRLLTKLN